MNLNLKAKETIVYKTSGLNRLLGSWFFKLLSFIALIISILAVIYIVGVFTSFLEYNNRLLGASVLVIGLFLSYLSFSYFYRGYLIHPENLNLQEILEQIKKGDQFNLWRVFSLELSLSLSLFGIDGQKNITSQALILALLKSKEVQILLIRLAVPVNQLSEFISDVKNSSNDISGIFIRALEIAIAEGHDQIETGDLFLALVLYDPSLKEAVFRLKVEPEDIANVIYWQTKIKRKYLAGHQLFNTKNLSLTGGIGRDWAYGYTNVLNRYSEDISELVKVGGLDSLELEAKDREITLIEDTLTRAENHNVVIVGDPGVGKKTTVYGLAKKIYHGQSTSILSNRRLLELDAEAILAGSDNPGEVIERIRSIFNEAAYAGNIILFIEGLASITTSDDKVGRVNAVEAILPFLESTNVYIVGTMSKKDYKNYFASNQILNAHFVKVELHEPSFDETIRIIEDVLPRIENRTGTIISYEAIKEAVKLTDKFIQDLPQPEKTINLLDQVATKKASNKENRMVLPVDIDQALTTQTNVPVGEIENREKEALLHLEDRMRERVIGQKEALSAIANALRRARAGVVDSKKPIGSFLFLGPTGVGKTQTAKTLADLYFGSEGSMIRFDMSEYQQKQDIYRLIGDPNSPDSQGLLTGAVKERPFSLLLLDEIEKADPNILNLFLQVLDEGQITDSFGQKCSFQSTIIIFTSNAGSEFIRQNVGRGDYQNLQKGLIDFVQKSNLFRPEFLNRFTQVIVFSPLSFEEIGQVAHLLIAKLTKLLEKERGIFITVDEPAIAKLAELGYDPEMGARPMERSLQEHLENVLAKKILAGEINRGDKITIGLNDLELNQS